MAYLQALPVLRGLSSGLHRQPLCLNLCSFGLNLTRTVERIEMIDDTHPKKLGSGGPGGSNGVALAASWKLSRANYSWLGISVVGESSWRRKLPLKKTVSTFCTPPASHTYIKRRPAILKGLRDPRHGHVHVLLHTFAQASTCSPHHCLPAPLFFACLAGSRLAQAPHLLLFSGRVSVSSY